MIENSVQAHPTAVELSQTRMGPALSATSRSSDASVDTAPNADTQSASTAAVAAATPTSQTGDDHLTINVGDVTGIPDFKPRTQQHTRPFMHGELYRIEPKDEFRQEWRITTRLRKLLSALFPSPQLFPYSLESPSSFFRKIQQRPLFAPMDMNNVPMALWTLFGAFVAISLIGMLHEYCLETRDFPMLYAAYGAASSLLFTKPHLPFIQPYNILGGTLVPTFIAVSVEKLAGNVSDVHLWLPAALSVSLSLFAMELLHCQHPPGGALALFYIANPSMHTLGYKYVPASLLGASIVFLVGIIVNNLQKVRHYPEYWMPRWWGDRPPAKA